MNFKTSFLLLIVVLSACQSGLDRPANHVDNQRLNSLITLEAGENVVFVEDFIADVSKIDSATVSSDKVKVILSEDKKKIIFQVSEGMETMVNLRIHTADGIFDVPCRKSDKINFVFTFNPGDKKYKEVRIAGQMNDWTPSAMPALTINGDGLYEINMFLSPGTYLYQMNLDGNQEHDFNNPDKVDNGFGKYNSILKIQGKQDSFPVIVTSDFHNTMIKLQSQNAVEKVLVYWQNYLLPDKFISVSSTGEIKFDIPAEALEMERSFIRVWATNSYGVSNDVLIPLQKGKVLTDARDIRRTDKHAQTMYFMLVDRFKNGSAENDDPLNLPDVNPKVDYWGGDLAGLQQVIESGYFADLGFNTLWISPLSENPDNPYGWYAPVKTKFSGYHGYWPVSSSKVEPRFGTNEELKNLVVKAHDQDMNVLLDYVANHVHQEHPLYQKHPEYATNLKLPDGTLNVEKWDEHRLTTWFDVFMPSLDFSKPEVVDMMTDSALYWIREFNLDGFRHDACKHIEEEFWRMLTKKMKNAFPDKNLYQIGETYGSPKLIASYLTTGMLDGQFDFNVYDIANTTFAGVGGDLQKVHDVLKSSLYTYGNHNLMGYISGNHDKPRFMAYASGDIRFGEDAKAAGWLREIGITDSVAYDKYLLFHTFNLTIPGIPVLYYGDEIGLTGGNDPDCRRMMKFDNLNNREKNLKDQVAKLANFRRENPVMIYGSFINIINSPDYWVYARKYFGKEVVVLINNNAENQKISFTLPAIFSESTFKSLFGKNYKIDDRKISIELGAYQTEVLYQEE